MFSNRDPAEDGSASTSATAHQQWQQGNARSCGFFGTTLVHPPITAGQFANNYPNAVSAHAKNAPSVLAPTASSSERATTVESVHEALEIQILRDQKTGRLGSLPPGASSTTSSSATSLYSKNVATKNRTTGGASAAASLVVGGAQRGSYFDLQQQGGQHHEIDHTTETVTSPLYRLSDIRVSGPIPTALIQVVACSRRPAMNSASFAFMVSASSQSPSAISSTLFFRPSSRFLALSTSFCNCGLSHCSSVESPVFSGLNWLSQADFRNAHRANE
ncbi:unnamed protein product [Amoebophrya sp. A120]|nr:unnamed protein product [Amoebophrya sp. A120]|eukprot:GSA120T00009597001.1